MAYRTLEINLQYARDLNNVNLFSKMEVYAVISISGGDKTSRQKTKTPADRDGNANPTWNFPIRFTVDEAALLANRLTLDFKLVCERALGDRDVGEVQVPLKELIDSPPKAGAEGRWFVSYQIRKPSGKPKGQLTFSYQFGENPAGSAAALTYGSEEPVMAYPVGSSSVYPPQTAYPAGQKNNHYPPAPPAGYGYPPPPPGYGYSPAAAPGYGYPPQSGYGYPPATVQQPAKKKNKFGLGLGAGLLGGLLVGDMISDVGGGAEFDCGGGFDF